MAINFIRLEFKSRCSQKTGAKNNAVSHSSYSSRERLYFEGTSFEKARFFNFSREKTEFSDVLIPDGVDLKFKNKEYLWNQVEKSEKRRDSQLYVDCVLALPDDECVDENMRKDIALKVANSMFVSKGLAVQIDIHPLQENDVVDPDTGDVVKKSHNHHAHLMITTRVFDEDGKGFHLIKPRNLFPMIRNGKVVGKNNCPDIFSSIQNKIFEKYGLDLRVDQKGIVPQKHIGPNRMRSQAYDLIVANDKLINENKDRSQNSSEILKALTSNKSTFTLSELDRFLDKHVSSDNRENVRSEVFLNPDLVQLKDKNSLVDLNVFTSSQVVNEEEKLIRISSRLSQIKSHRSSKLIDPYIKSHNLNNEQSIAFKGVLEGKLLSLVEGHAGTGKSYLLSALRDKYKDDGYFVRAFGPDHATAEVLKSKGFDNATTLHRALFLKHFEKMEVKNGKEVWLIDEAGKLGNDVILELFKVAEKNKIQVVLCGNSAQLPSISRGGMLKVLCEKFGCQRLENIQRQKGDSQKIISKNLATGDFSKAFDLIAKKDGFQWSPTKDKSLESCAKAWVNHRLANPKESSVMIAHTNAEVSALNELVHTFRQQVGEVKDNEFSCLTPYGEVVVSEGDFIEFRKKDTKLSVENGLKGVLIKASKSKFVVSIDRKGKKEEISFNPSKYSSFRLGYAQTHYRSQGTTVDQAFVLSSSMNNKEMFYVGLTRHIHNVKCFVSMEEAKDLESLKMQALRTSHRPTTFDYTHLMRSASENHEKQKKDRIDFLKDSKSMLQKAQGYWLDIKGKISVSIQKKSDQKSNREFFHPTINRDSFSGAVKLVKKDIENLPLHEKNLQLTNISIVEKNPSKKVLLVMDEVTFIICSKLPGEDYNVVLSAKDTKDLKQTDWTPLFSKDIVIFPSMTGEYSSKSIDMLERQLKRQGAKSISLINRDLLETKISNIKDLDFLGDNEKKTLKDLVIRSENRAVSIDRLIPFCDKNLEGNEKLGRLLTLNEILYRVDERIREDFKNKDISNVQIKADILKETTRIIKEYNLDKSGCYKSDSFQKAVYEARSGCKPDEKYLKTVSDSVNILSLDSKIDKNSYSFQAAVAQFSELGLGGKEILRDKADLSNFLDSNSLEICTQKDMNRSIQNEI